MKSGAQDQAEGLFHEVKGRFKEIAGKFMGNSKWEAEGRIELISGQVQEKIGHFKKVLSNCRARPVMRRSVRAAAIEVA